MADSHKRIHHFGTWYKPEDEKQWACLIKKSRLHGSPSRAEIYPLPVWIIFIPQLLRGDPQGWIMAKTSWCSSPCLLSFVDPASPTQSSDFAFSSLRVFGLNTHFFRAWAESFTTACRNSLSCPAIREWWWHVRSSSLVGRSFHNLSLMPARLTSAWVLCKEEYADIWDSVQIFAFPSHHRAAFAAKRRRCALSS